MTTSYGFRRFRDGQEFDVDGIRMRVRVGRKSDDDLVLDWLTSSGWRPITFEALGLIYSFLYENEEHLYPRHRGFKGGGKVREFLNDTQRHGHIAAWDKVTKEKAAKDSQMSLL